ncbi:hypothetical protein KP509_1Z217400 [Ceratopteris richardii]|nr:hypothetical protein KP509_1Z217400 [Ceratopteris richardii]
MKEMKITIKSSALVRPAMETPNHVLWDSNIDLVIPRIHIPTVYFYESRRGAREVFDCEHLKESLSRALVPFYPMAGRLKDKGRGRVDIDCNGKGALFVEATSDGCISEYGEYYAPCMKMRKLVPHVDYSKGLSSFPILILQVTFFRCGGVAIGVGVHHHVADGLAALRFLNYWSDVARGVETEVKPFFERTLLKARDPPTPKFRHVEYQAPPLLLTDELVNIKRGSSRQVSSEHEHCSIADRYGTEENDHTMGKTSNAMVSDALSKAKERMHLLKNAAYTIANPGSKGLLTQPTESTGISFTMLSEPSKARDSHNESEYEFTTHTRLKGTEAHPCFASGMNKDVGGHKLAPEPVKGAKVAKEKSKALLEEIPSVCDVCRQSLEELGKSKEDRKQEVEDYGPISAELFVFTQQQVDALKKKAAEDALPTERPFTSYEVLSAHIWRCACVARGLQDAQPTKLYIATDGRSRLQPPLPPDYFGNVIFTATPVAQVVDIVKTPLVEAARHIRQTVQAMDDEYLRSAIDYLELQPDLAKFSRGAHSFRTPNLGITSWVRLPIYGADFGCGPPVSMGPAGVPFEGLAYLLPGPPGDNSIRLSVTFTSAHMIRFQELIHQI